MRIIILFPLSILIASTVIAQQPTEKQLEQQKQLNNRLLKDQKEAKEKESKSKGKTFIGARWSGTMTSVEIITHSNGVYNGIVEIHGDASFKDALPTMYRDDGITDLNFTDDKGPGSHIVNSEITDITGKKCVGTCNSIGQAELHAVVINEESNTYDIEVIFPVCVGTDNCKDDGVYKADDLEAIVSDQPLGTNKDVLTGSKKVTAELPGGLGTVTRTITWSLTKAKEDDVELIVTPENYDNWLPEPGRNELNKGSVMTINLKLQGKNRKPLKVKVESFELTLSNTSTEPGITINYPINPDANQLPDLRFLLYPGIESIDADQFVSLGSPDGVNGKAMIASYDGGGYTTLTAEAILKDQRRIEGHLLIAGGKTAIPVPKRDQGSVIASAWLKVNGNPNDMDDKETSNGNNYNGDGLTAYEEYRGVISQGKFKRLDPRKKEVGVDVIQNELSFFSDGIKRFENATGLTTVIFHQDLNEMDMDRRMNKNTLTNHNYDQYVLRLANSVIPSSALGKAYGGPGTPAKTRVVVVDYTKIKDEYSVWQRNARDMNMPVPFTLKEQLASVIAHELGHGVSCWHHGRTGKVPGDTIVPIEDAIYRIFSHDGRTEITLRPYPLKGDFGIKGSQESGDLSCIMTYCPYYDWAYRTNGSERFYYMVPILPLGNKICHSGEGTGINKKDAAGNNNYFGDATFGNCLAQINLRN